MPLLSPQVLWVPPLYVRDMHLSRKALTLLSRYFDRRLALSSHFLDNKCLMQWVLAQVTRYALVIISAERHSDNRALDVGWSCYSSWDPISCLDILQR